MDLKTAEKHLDAWLNAELAISTGQSYRVGTRQLTRANLSEVRRQIQYWRAEVSRLKGKGPRKNWRVVPRDL